VEEPPEHPIAASPAPLFPLICVEARAVFFAATGIYSVAQCNGSRSRWARGLAKQVLRQKGKGIFAISVSAY